MVNGDGLDRARAFSSANGTPSDNGSGTRRRRNFIARAVSQEAPVTLPGRDEDDVPVLTEVVSEETKGPERDESVLDDERVALLAAEMAEAVGRQLAAELPTLIEATLITAGQDLRAGIASTMETALRDFAARRKQLRLPFEDPDFGKQ